MCLLKSENVYFGKIYFDDLDKILENTNMINTKSTWNKFLKVLPEHDAQELKHMLVEYQYKNVRLEDVVL